MPLKQPIYLYPENDQTITLGPVFLGATQFSPTPTYVNDCVGTFTLQDADGNPVAGATNLAFTYVPDSNGLYTVTIVGSAFNPSPANTYNAVITVTTASQNARAVWTIRSYVQARNSS